MKIMGDELGLGQINPPPPWKLVSDNKLEDSTVFVGVELEMEGAGNPFFLANEADSHYVYVTEDNSLKYQGVEFLFSRPMRGSDITHALGCMQRLIDSCADRYTAGDRGSTHLHLNIRDLTEEQFIMLLVMSYIMEPYLFSLCPPQRASNSFCVPGHRTKDISVILTKILYGHYGYNTEFHKYRGIGLNSLSTLGSLEYRMFDSCLNTYKILEWINILLRIRKLAKEVNREFFVDPKTIDLNYLLSRVAGENNYSNNAHMKNLMWQNIREVSYVFAKDNRRRNQQQKEFKAALDKAAAVPATDNIPFFGDLSEDLYSPTSLPSSAFAILSGNNDAGSTYIPEVLATAPSPPSGDTMQSFSGLEHIILDDLENGEPMLTELPTLTSTEDT